MDKITHFIDVEKLLDRAVAYAPNLLAAVAILLAFWAGYRLARGPIRLILKRAGFHKNLIRLLVDSVLRFVLLALGFVMAAGQVGLNIGAMLTGIGVAGIAIGFAAQDSLANTIAGFMIFWDKPFEVGEWVTVAEEYGQVKEITLRTTRIRTNNNTYVVIPNKRVIDKVLVNHSKHGATRLEIPVGIAYKEQVEAARGAIVERVKGLDGVLGEPSPDVVVKQLGASSVDMIVRVWIGDAGSEQPVYYRVMEASKLALDEAGIEIPYHHLQLFIENVQDRVWEKAAGMSRLMAGGEKAGGAVRPLPRKGG